MQLVSAAHTGCVAQADYAPLAPLWMDVWPVSACQHVHVPHTYHKYHTRTRHVPHVLHMYHTRTTRTTQPPSHLAWGWRITLDLIAVCVCMALSVVSLCPPYRRRGGRRSLWPYSQSELLFQYGNNLGSCGPQLGVVLHAVVV